MNIGIVLLATNGYFPLGIRFIKKFMNHYIGNNKITFYFFSNENPKEYIPNEYDVEYFYQRNDDWVSGTNLKFKSIVSIGSKLKSDYLFYFDVDTNINIDFDDHWFLGDMVAGQHYGDTTFMINTKNYDRNPNSMAYIPEDTELEQIYYYGAFFGGISSKCIDMCNTLFKWQNIDKNIGYEPGVNDESYINKYFHYNPPDKIILNSEFKFDVSCKGGIQNMRDVNINIESIKNNLKRLKNNYIDILNGVVIE